ncbi:MAG: glycosyltransferase [Planctomycetota bacterium]
MSGRILTFTNLFPSAAFPTHGLFVRERMRRVAAASGLDWVVVCPVPKVPPVLRRGDYAAYAAMPERETVDGVEVWHPKYTHLPGFSTGRQANWMAKAALPFVQRLAADGPTVIDAHYVYPDGVAALQIGHALGLPVVVTARGTDINLLAGYPAVRAQIRRLAGKAAALQAVSEELRQRFVAAAGLDDGAVRLSRNGVDLQRFIPGSPKRAREALGLPAAGQLVLGVGRLVEAKGFHHAVAALEPLEGAQLVLIGDGPDRANLQRAAGDRLIWLGKQPPDRVALAMQACDVLALPSEREGWPNVVTEALACGLPVVASAVGAVPEMLASPVVGRAVPVGDVAALRAALAEVLSAPPERVAVRAHAEQFSWDQPIGDLVELLQGTLR